MIVVIYGWKEKNGIYLIEYMRNRENIYFKRGERSKAVKNAKNNAKQLNSDFVMLFSPIHEYLENYCYTWIEKEKFILTNKVKKDSETNFVQAW